METLLVLNISPDLEEDLVDYLLQLDFVSGFTSSHVYGHGRHGLMTVAEQVIGRRKRMQFEVVMKEAQVADLLAELAAQVGRDISYWQLPVSNFGRIA